MNDPQNVTTLDPILRVPFMQRYDDASGIKRDNAAEKYREENPELANLPDETRRTIKKLIRQARDKVLEDKGHPDTGKPYFDAAWYFNMELDLAKWVARRKDLPEMEMLDAFYDYYYVIMDRLSVHERVTLHHFGQTKGNSLTGREFAHVSGGDINYSILLHLVEKGILTSKKVWTTYRGKIAYSIIDEQFHRWLIYQCSREYRLGNKGRKANGEAELTVSEYIADPTPEPWRTQFNELESQRPKRQGPNLLKQILKMSKDEREKILEALEAD